MSIDRNKEIGNRIKQAREAKELTLQEVADIVGVAKSTIQRYESGSISKIKLPVIESIANALNVSPLWITLKSNSMQDTQQEVEIISSKKDSLLTRLLAYYEALNGVGREEAAKRVQELTYLPKYSTNEVLYAAHEIPGATEEEKKHDNDIMDDENF